LAIYELNGIRPELPKEGDYWIAPNAIVLGRVRLLKGASVWFGAVLRGDNDWITLGENSNVQDNSVLHTDMGFPMNIGSHVTIGHSVTLHGCSIADNCIIGMGCTIMNSAKIGAYSIVGANALIPEYKEFPERSLILGAPARVARKIEEEQANMLALTAAHYVENAMRYARGLKPIG
jgi:carbonic anhydrase/acetyltransferase-like protein (isoleucine patch superfamily)